MGENLMVLKVTSYINCISSYSAPANASVCPAQIMEFRSFLFDSEELYRFNLLAFDLSEEATDAIVQVKECVDELPTRGRQKIYDSLNEMAFKCDN